MKWAKWGVYYFYIPIVLFVGFKTVRLENFQGAVQPQI